MNFGQYLNLIARAILIILPLSICACQKVAPVDPGIEDEEYRVMAAVLKEIRFHRLLLSRDSLAVPHFSDTTDRPTYTRIPILRRPIEFGHASDTSRARALLNTMQNIFGDATYYLAVGAETLDSAEIRYWSPRHEVVCGEPPDMVTDFGVKNQKRYTLSRSRFHDSLIVSVVDQKELGDWEQFYAGLPLADGIVLLSRVGFSRDRARAVMFYVRSDSYPHGQGYFMHLEKIYGDWRVIEPEEFGQE